MTIDELKAQVDTIFSMICLAIMTKEKYMDILLNQEKFAAVFPGVEFENPKISFSIDGNGEIFKTTKNEIVIEHNHNLFKAWQIALGIVGMTGALEAYLKSLAENITGNKIHSMGIFYKFSTATKIDITDFPDYDQINKYYQVRHIVAHNRGIIDEKFSDKTKSAIHEEKPYVFFPTDIKRYKNLIIQLAEFIESKIK